MTVFKTSSLFHLWIDMKRQLLDYRMAFSKPDCMCLTTLPQHQSFWATCSQVLANMDELVSLSLQILCETNDCICLEKKEITSGFEALYQLFQSLCFVLNNHKDHKQTGLTLSMLENQQLAYNLDAIAKRTHRCTCKILTELKNCGNGHDILVSKYTTCAMGE